MIFPQVYKQTRVDSDMRDILKNGTLYRDLLSAWIDFDKDLDFLMWLRNKTISNIILSKKETNSNIALSKVKSYAKIRLSPALCRLIRERNKEKYFDLINYYMSNGFANYVVLSELFSCIPREDIVSIFFKSNYPIVDLYNPWNNNQETKYLISLYFEREKDRLKALPDYPLLGDGEFKTWLG